jgi:hypothetical protein
VQTLPEGEKDSGNHQAGIQVAGGGKLEHFVFQGTSIIKPALIPVVILYKVTVRNRRSTVLLCLNLRHLNHAGWLPQDRIRGKSCAKRKNLRQKGHKNE